MLVETNVSGTSLQGRGRGTALFPERKQGGRKADGDADGAEAGLNKVFSGSFEIDLARLVGYDFQYGRRLA